jgi:hypothetical protein
VSTRYRRRERVEQLAGLLDGTLASDDAPAELRRLATLAGTVGDEVELPVLDADTRDRMRTRVMAEVHNDLHAAAAETTAAPARRRGAVALAGGVASVVIGAAGVAVAAQEALPGDLLYNVKQATESVRVAAAGDLTEQGRLELALAEERLEELTAAVERGDVRDEVLVDTLARMDVRARDGAVTLVRVAERDGDAALLDEVAAFTERQAGGIVAVFDDLPVTVRPHAEDSLALLRAIRLQLIEPLLSGEGFTAAAQVTELEERLRSTTLPAAPRDADGGTTTTTTTTTRPADEPTGGSSPSAPSSGGSLPDAGDLEGVEDPDRGVVPRLPGPLDDVGDAVDDTVDGVLDGTGRIVDDTRRGVGDVVDGAGDAVDDTVDGVVDGVGDVVDDTLGGVGGLLGGGSDRD